MQQTHYFKNTCRVPIPTKWNLGPSEDSTSLGSAEEWFYSSHIGKKKKKLPKKAAFKVWGFCLHAAHIMTAEIFLNSEFNYGLCTYIP